ncbi:hypothetical protein B0H34DRAFT_697920 [Crassisporium funariophilum]|nr:hypothetical protein B0H34DRAFT_697920 [Crassisporium funariophilum]
MKKPRSWNDKSLLLEEPFRNWFAARGEQGLPSRRTNKADTESMRNTVLAEEIANTRWGPEVVQAWLDLAFKRTESGDPDDRVLVDAQTLKLFVEFYWALYQGDETAQKFLIKARRARGYMWINFKGKVEEISNATRTRLPNNSSRQSHAVTKTKGDTCLESRVRQKAADSLLRHTAGNMPSGSSRPVESVDRRHENLRSNKQAKGEMTKARSGVKAEHPTQNGIGSTTLARTNATSKKTNIPSRIEPEGCLVMALPKAVISRPADTPCNPRKRRSPGVDDREVKRRAIIPIEMISPPSKTGYSGLATVKREQSSGSYTVPPEDCATNFPVRLIKEENDPPLPTICPQTRPARAKPPTKMNNKGTTQVGKLIVLQDVASDRATCGQSGGRTVGNYEDSIGWFPQIQDSLAARKRPASMTENPQNKRRQPRSQIIVTPVENPELSLSNAIPCLNGVSKASELPELPLRSQTDPNKKRGRGQTPKIKNVSLPSKVQTSPDVLMTDSPQESDQVKTESILSTLKFIRTSHKLHPQGRGTSSLLPPPQQPAPKLLLDDDLINDPMKLYSEVQWSTEDGDFKRHRIISESMPSSSTPRAKNVATGILTPSDHRQPEVCEAFDWFRSYQGGVYHARNVAKGYLLSAFASRRDKFEHGGRLIISHGGGKAESLHCSKGKTTIHAAGDQLAEDKSVRALLDNYHHRRPLALLIDDKYVLFPYDLGAKDVTYAVLGFYTIVNAWAEYQPANTESGQVVRYKFAFQWCDDQGVPWWLEQSDNPYSQAPHLLSRSSTPSKSLGNPDLPTPQLTPSKSVTREYSIHHLPKVKMEHGPLSHQWQPESSHPESISCGLCHEKSPRIYIQSWVCLRPKCSNFWREPIRRQLLTGELDYYPDFLKLLPSTAIPPGFGKLEPSLPMSVPADGVVTSYAFTRGWRCDRCGRLSCRYNWEQWECMHCLHNHKVEGSLVRAKELREEIASINYKDHFINKISEIKQQQARNFIHERGFGNVQSFILPNGRGTLHHIQPGTLLGRIDADEIFIDYQKQASEGVLKFRRRGALLTNYFSQNSGEPYQYVGGTANTVPFEEAPGAVLRARELIQRRISQAISETYEFNEVLSAAYMERQKMAFHSDNEIGLGPVVAGLSLGSPALMHFRLNAKYDPEQKQKGILMTFVLRHGDVLVMEGAGVQKYYEHTVVPNNFRIAATARQIRHGHA